MHRKSVHNLAWAKERKLLWLNAIVDDNVSQRETVIPLSVEENSTEILPCKP